MKTLILMVCLALAACDQPPDMTEQHSQQYARENPVGRYQMLPGPNGKVYVLDTRAGWLKLCGPNDAADSMFCGAETKD